MVSICVSPVFKLLSTIVKTFPNILFIIMTKDPLNSVEQKEVSEADEQQTEQNSNVQDKGAKPEPFGCKICGIYFNEKKHYDTHMRNKHPICPICNIQTKTVEGLIQHLKAKHMGSEEDESVEEFGYFDKCTFECPECLMQFDNEMNMINHRINKHNFKQFVCEFCSECFYNKKNLVRHKKIYHEDDFTDDEEFEKLKEELQDNEDTVKYQLTDEQFKERIEILKSGNAKRREKIIRSLIKSISEEQKAEILRMILSGEVTKDFSSRLLIILIKCKYEPVKPHLWQFALSDITNLRHTAIRGIGKFKMQDHLDKLIEWVNEKDIEFDEFTTIISALSYMENEEAMNVILSFANSPDWKKRRHVAKSLENIYHSTSISTLRYFLSDKNDEVKKFAHSALQTIEKMLKQQKLQFVEKTQQSGEQKEYPYQEILELTEDIIEEFNEQKSGIKPESENIEENEKENQSTSDEVEKSLKQTKPTEISQKDDDGFTPFSDSEEFEEMNEPMRAELINKVVKSEIPQKHKESAGKIDIESKTDETIQQSEIHEKDQSDSGTGLNIISEKDLFKTVADGMVNFKDKVPNSEKFIILDTHDIMCGFMTGEPDLKKLLNVISYLKSRNMNYILMVDPRDIAKIEKIPDFAKIKDEKTITAPPSHELLSLITIALENNAVIVTNRSFVRYKNQDYSMDDFISKRVITYVFINEVFAPDKPI